ncbi:putative 4-aminobutyrate aminotransferase [Clostridium pasteurianum DSM 525 = ATCC 6013]|uniref:Aminotransferase class-III n=1 Tax=Clostridium pasteurianum DSM 525 = ATCC 6013 TaxID=1262449 RepID=A0A0H3JBL5_CLOPA|nr:putative 4-aminobutyrate aminotransferase [Clostridium pasteurianum DSM 525 = ATCC 6013]AJA53928.1 putative 4-aminobutyrate aminotransferase [Clostridium pasteurianum DSM 525 = ATCC 6013]KRU14047.1 aminotransferase class-III [Clostridium pasteurianum DSM 525 = ATCC 6013]
MACASALKTIEIMERDHLENRSMQIGKKVMDTYHKWMEKYQVIGDIRGLGGMVGLEFVTDQESKTPNAPLVSAVVAECVQNGLMVESAGIYGNVIRFLAPLVITDEQLEAGLAILEDAIVKCM